MKRVLQFYNSHFQCSDCSEPQTALPIACADSKIRTRKDLCAHVSHETGRTNWLFSQGLGILWSWLQYFWAFCLCLMPNQWFNVVRLLRRVYITNQQNGTYPSTPNHRIFASWTTMWWSNVFWSLVSWSFASHYKKATNKLKLGNKPHVIIVCLFSQP